MMTIMKLSHSSEYDAPLAEVYAMLVDPDFREHAAKRSGVLEVSVDVQPRGEGHTVHMDQVQPLQGVPSFATKFAGETTRATVEERWADPGSCTLTVETPGKPTRIRGSYTLTEQAGRTVQRFDGECKVSVPLIGGKLEKVMGDLFARARDEEARAGRDWLAGKRP